MNAILWFVFSFAALLLALTAVVLYLQGRRRETQDEVLARLQMGMAETEQEPQGSLAIARVGNPVVGAVYRQLWRAGYEVEPSAVTVGIVAAGVAGLLLLWVSGLFLGLLTLLFLLLASYVFLQQRAGRRKQQIIAQLPDFLEHVSRALIAGNTLEEAFGSAAREAQEPLRALFMGVARQVRLGAPIEDALTQLAVVHDLADVHVLSMSARVNRRYGGSIRNMIKSMIQVIRQRETAVSELRALTAETRFSAGVLALIPVGITLFILYRNPGYYTSMWLDPTGRMLLFAGVALQLAGIVVIWRMMRSVTTT